MFDRVLIANRGEIACRIARTCRRLGIHSVAVYSAADACATHVTQADEAYYLGPPPARESYLRGELILAIAKKSSAQAIHPGYGFLAENAEFAEACEQAGVIFIGPPAPAIRAMGAKSAAKALMGRAGIPLVPGYHEEAQDLETLAKAAEKIGYPVLIKASAGGGGKGMQVVESPAGLKEAIASAKREAAAAFGDDRLLIERYLERARHIEIQVFADRHGNIVHLFERDCSLQRRHQKVMEEAPAPGITEDLRRVLGAAAVAVARTIGYVNAGTVEFLVLPDGNFYFMEMNTRLQVEHPVTEMITGQDLVEWQLRIAAGELLPHTQEALSIHGHALEARIYAEDPEHGFLPSGGRIEYLRTPIEDIHVRLDSGVRQGDEVGAYYDPLLAKLIVWDQDRDGALRRLRKALGEYRVVGVTANLGLLSALAAHPAFTAAELDTGFIGRCQAELFPGRQPASNYILALGALSELLRLEREATERARQSADPWSLWHTANSWRLNDDSRHTLYLRDGERQITVIARHRPDHYLLELPEERMRVRGWLEGDCELLADLDKVRLRATVVRQDDNLTILAWGHGHTLKVYDPLTLGMGELETISGGLTAPMPGMVIEIMVKAGEGVEKGAPLMTLEAMKMEHTITAPRSGSVERINYCVGDRVQEGAELLVIASE